MPSHDYTEDQLVEQPAIRLFAKLARKYVMPITLALVATVETPTDR